MGTIINRSATLTSPVKVLACDLKVTSSIYEENAYVTNDLIDSRLFLSLSQLERFFRLASNRNQMSMQIGRHSIQAIYNSWMLCSDLPKKKQKMQRQVGFFGNRQWYEADARGHSRAAMTIQLHNYRQCRWDLKRYLLHTIEGWWGSRWRCRFVGLTSFGG
jgi:hypothetical protein